MRCFVCLTASLAFTGCGVQPVPEATEAVPISATAPVPPGADDPLTALKGKTPQERSPAYRKAPEADRAFGVLDAALEKVWLLDDPRSLLAVVIQTAAEVDPIRACDRIRTVAPRLWKLNLPPTSHVVWASFARSAAAQDPNLRDALLRLAVIDGRRALADPELWKVPPPPKEGIPLDNPKQLVIFARQMLEYDLRLWNAILEQRSDRASAIDLTTKLFADAKAKGYCHLGCIGRVYEFEVARDLANLDPTLLLPVIVKNWKRDHVALFCVEEARDRWVNRMRDSITESLAVASIDNGGHYKTASGIITHYEFARAWEAAATLPDYSNNPNFPGLRHLRNFIEEWAWRDPEAALALAESEPDNSARRDLIQRVAGVWAYKRPEQIERAVQNQDNAVRRGWARTAAAEELEWRKQGNPPRDTRETAPRKFSPEFPKPSAVPWVPPPDVQKLLEHPTKVEEADSRLCEIAQHIGQWGPANHALEALNRVKSTYRFVNTATWVARNLIGRQEDE